MGANSNIGWVSRGAPVRLQHWKGEVREQWPIPLRVQQFPRSLLS
jgi:hypothetical protein